MTTPIYLLFQWTDEREAKMHIGVFSSKEKAQTAAQLDFEESNPSKTLDWQEDGTMGFTGSRDSDDPYEIEEFKLDVFIDESEVYSDGGYYPDRVKEVNL